MKRGGYSLLALWAIIAFACPCNAQTGPSSTREATPPITPAPPVASGTESYVIGPGDVVAVTVWKEPSLSGSLLVRPDGMVSMSLLGDVQAAGLTPLKLANEIATKLKKYYQDPNVSVVVDQIHSKVIYLLGEVAKPGPVEMAPNMTFLEAISSSGGLSEFANRKKIYILRDVGGMRLKIPVRYKEALDGDRNFDVVLKPGDTIVVP